MLSNYQKHLYQWNLIFISSDDFKIFNIRDRAFQEFKDCETHYRGEGLILFAGVSGSCKKGDFQIPLNLLISLIGYFHYFDTLYTFDILNAPHTKGILLDALYTS